MSLVQNMAGAFRSEGFETYVLQGAPNKPNVLSLTTYGGRSITVDQAIVGDIQNVQVYMRSDTYDYGYDRIWRAYNLIRTWMKKATAFEGYEINDVSQSPSYIGVDEKKRWYSFTFNIKTRKLLDNI